MIAVFIFTLLLLGSAIKDDAISTLCQFGTIIMVVYLMIKLQMYAFDGSLFP